MQKLFSLTNDEGVCAAVAQSWLKKSLKKSKPSTSIGHLGNKTQMEEVQKTAGQDSETALPANGMKITDRTVSGDHGWFQNIVWASGERGFKYLTMKFGGKHASACYIGEKELFFIDAEEGLFHFDSKAEFNKFVSEFYEKRGFQASEFKTYTVELSQQEANSKTCTII